eukprot:CAMPEP_0201520166 /NCGR_PEP_ID=MMETSP0161_2-20130828/10532_1 /ASSEMBLY_ACC=CAM_ASM_000251 /TAXON_ID=180227 /ORGANISM="Neoparamoeba aestuarina, Strain SoJaBio B1-5/56/2" /LENGTH=803 /DNA_ID=CAMNT_0047918445 /DNA_START=393 /DNA_END=2804 /DNA_ORIENTATION=+
MANFLSSLLFIPEDRGTRLPLPILEGKRALSLLMIFRSAVLQKSLTVFIQQDILPIILSFFTALKEVGYMFDLSSMGKDGEEGWWEELLLTALDIVQLCSNLEEGKRKEVGEMLCELGSFDLPVGLMRASGMQRSNVFLLVVKMLLIRPWNRVLFCLPFHPSPSSCKLNHLDRTIDLASVPSFTLDKSALFHPLLIITEDKNGPLPQQLYRGGEEQIGGRGVTIESLPGFQGKLFGLVGMIEGNHAWRVEIIRGDEDCCLSLGVCEGGLQIPCASWDWKLKNAHKGMAVRVEVSMDVGVLQVFQEGEGKKAGICLYHTEVDSHLESFLFPYFLISGAVVFHVKYTNSHVPIHSSPVDDTHPLSIPFASWSRSPFTPLVECYVTREMVCFLEKFKGGLTFPIEHHSGMPVFDIMQKGNEFAILGTEDEEQDQEEGLSLQSANFFRSRNKNLQAVDFVKRNGESLCSLILSSTSFHVLLKEEGWAEEICVMGFEGKEVLESQSQWIQLLASLLPLPLIASALLASPSSHPLLLFAIGGPPPPHVWRLRHHLQSPSTHYLFFSHLCRPLLSQIVPLFPLAPKMTLNPIFVVGCGGLSSVFEKEESEELLLLVEKAVDTGLVQVLVDVLRQERKLRAQVKLKEDEFLFSSSPLYSQVLSLLASLLSVLGGKKVWEDGNFVVTGEKVTRRGEERKGEIAGRLIKTATSLVDLFTEDMEYLLQATSSNSSSPLPFFMPVPYFVDLLHSITYLFSIVEFFHLLPALSLVPLHTAVNHFTTKSTEHKVLGEHLKQFLDNLDFFSMKVKEAV